MNNDSSILTDHSGHDPYTSCQAREQALNAAILQADISENFEQYLDIFDAFYAHDVEVSSESREQPVRGKERVRWPENIVSKLQNLRPSLLHGQSDE